MFTKLLLLLEAQQQLVVIHGRWLLLSLNFRGGWDVVVLRNLEVLFTFLRLLLLWFLQDFNQLRASDSRHDAALAFLNYFSLEALALLDLLDLRLQCLDWNVSIDTDFQVVDVVGISAARS